MCVWDPISGPEIEGGPPEWPQKDVPSRRDPLRSWTRPKLRSGETDEVAGVLKDWGCVRVDTGTKVGTPGGSLCVCGNRSQPGDRGSAPTGPPKTFFSLEDPHGS